MNVELLIWGIVVTLFINGLANILCGSLRLEKNTDNYGGFYIFAGLCYVIFSMLVLLT